MTSSLSPTIVPDVSTAIGHGPDPATLQPPMICPSTIPTSVLTPATMLLGGELSRQRVIATTSPDIPSTSHILFIEDKQSQRRFMIGTGTDVSAISSTPVQRSPSCTLRSVNHSPIKTYGHYSYSVNANVLSLVLSSLMHQIQPWALISFTISTRKPISVTPNWLITKPNLAPLVFSPMVESQV